MSGSNGRNPHHPGPTGYVGGGVGRNDPGLVLGGGCGTGWNPGPPCGPGGGMGNGPGGFCGVGKIGGDLCKGPWKFLPGEDTCEAKDGAAAGAGIWELLTHVDDPVGNIGWAHGLLADDEIEGWNDATELAEDCEWVDCVSK